jgi:ribosome-associated heat shock protein Hsp15
MTDGQRIDKWLWHARFARTRTAAQTLARSGGVRINRVKNDSASRMVKAGDVLTVAQGSGVRVVKVVSFSERRGPAAAAQALYEELAEPMRPERSNRAASALDVPPRPNKRDRRQRQQLKRAGSL